VGWRVKTMAYEYNSSGFVSSTKMKVKVMAEVSHSTPCAPKIENGARGQEISSTPEINRA